GRAGLRRGGRDDRLLLPRRTGRLRRGLAQGRLRGGAGGLAAVPAAGQLRTAGGGGGGPPEGTPAPARPAAGVGCAAAGGVPARVPARSAQTTPRGGEVMALGLKGRTALVCASTGGLGEATARALALEGARVVVSGRRGERARAIAAELPDAIGVEADLLAPGGVERLVSAAGEVDILVLNGPGPRPGPAATMTGEDLTAAVDALVRPHLRLISLVLPGMRARGWGPFLAIGSGGAASPLPNLALSNL